MPRSLRWWWLAYGALLSALAVFSYALVVPNLILSTWAPFWQFQTWMWHTFPFGHLLTQVYVVFIGLLFGGYLVIWHKSQSVPLDYRTFFKWWLLLLIPVWLGYNLLSADIFNYIFNARIIALYHENPYTTVALDFPQDPWVRFMHNSHTGSVYGWSWNLFTLLPYVLGLGKFLITWLMFKGLAVLSLVALWGSFWLKTDNKPSKFEVSDLVLVFLNPLLLIEIGMNGHNDLWMMVPAVVSLLLLLRKKSWLWIGLSLGLLVLSLSVKIGTVVLLPLWLAMVATKFSLFKTWSEFIAKYWAVFAALLMFAPLFHERSQYFLPWYFSWVLIWLPFFPKLSLNSLAGQGVRFLKILLICFTFTSLLRYVPWLQIGNYTPYVTYSQRVITWSAIPLAMIVIAVIAAVKKLKLLAQ